MNRRKFLGRTGLGCMALATDPLADMAFAGSAGKPRIPIGFLGATHSHGPQKIKLAMASADWELIGVSESSEAGRKVCENLGANLVSTDELFRRAKVVAVESDVRDHAAHALLALKAGKHVHLEKPGAVRLAEMERIIALAREKKLLVQTGYMWRYHPGFGKIIGAVREGWLGDVFMVRGFISNHLAPERRAEWGEFSGGAMFELGSHLVDATVRLLGRPNKVTPFLHSHGDFKDSFKDNNVAVLEYDRATVVLMNTALQPAAAPLRSFEVLGTNGTASLQPIEPPALTIDLAKAAGPYPKGAMNIAMPPYRRYEGDFVELAAAVRGERALSVSLDEELLVEETLLRVSGMM